MHTYGSELDQVSRIDDPPIPNDGAAHSGVAREKLSETNYFIFPT